MRYLGHDYLKTPEDFRKEHEYRDKHVDYEKEKRFNRIFLLFIFSVIIVASLLSS